MVFVLFQILYYKENYNAFRRDLQRPFSDREKNIEKIFPETGTFSWSAASKEHNSVDFSRGGKTDCLTDGKFMIH